MSVDSAPQITPFTANADVSIVDMLVQSRPLPATLNALRN